MRDAYPAEIQQNEAAFWLVTFPDVSEAATDARDCAQALAGAQLAR